jgi:hypothetical protein
VRELLVQGLWHATEDGYEVHDWRDWNATRDQVETRRKAAKARLSRWRASQADPGVPNAPCNGVSNGVSNGVRNGVAHGARNGVGNATATQRNAEDQDQEQKDPGLAAGAPPCGNVENAENGRRVVPIRPPDDAPAKVLTQVAVALLKRHQGADVDEADLKEDFKRACAAAHLRYAAGDVRKALDAARAILARHREAHA